MVFGLLVVLSFLLPLAGNAVVRVKGYYKNNGTYVQPHYRSDPNGTIFDNWSTKGNVNPYTGKAGWIDPLKSYSPPITTTVPKQHVLGDSTYSYSKPQSGWLIKNRKNAEVFYVDSDLCLQWIINERAALKHFGNFWWEKIREFDTIPTGYKFCNNLE